MTEQADAPVEVTLEEPQPAETATPLAQTAAIMATLLDSCPGIEAHAEGTRIIATSEGVTVQMNVLSISADVEAVLQEPV